MHSGFSGGAASRRWHLCFTLCSSVTSVVKKTDHRVHRGPQRNALRASDRSSEQTLALVFYPQRNALRLFGRSSEQTLAFVFYPVFLCDLCGRPPEAGTLIQSNKAGARPAFRYKKLQTYFFGAMASFVALATRNLTTVLALI